MITKYDEITYVQYKVYSNTRVINYLSDKIDSFFYGTFSHSTRNIKILTSDFENVKIQG